MEGGSSRMGPISLKGMFTLALVKKEHFHGSYCGMRYMLCNADGELKAHTYPEPFSFDATDPKLIVAETFPFSNEGIEQAVEWLNAQYLENYKK